MVISVTTTPFSIYPIQKICMAISGTFITGEGALTCPGLTISPSGWTSVSGWSDVVLASCITILLAVEVEDARLTYYFQLKLV